VLGGKIEKLLTYSQAPVCDQVPPGTGDRIMHARLVTNNGVLMAGDAMPGQPYEGMKGFSLTLTYPTAAEAKRVYDGLNEGGRVTMPLQKTFWAETCGMLVDRFGTPWIVNGELFDV
jgi:PhnB protein